VTDPFDSLRSALEDRYAIEREIGRGGMATVFLAEDVRHARKVAVKVLKPELAESVGADRFLREIRTTANLRHPHIVPLYDSGQAAGFLYYVMPFVEGESLEQRLERERQLSVDDTLKIAGQVADALAYAHERGLLHRDIKPGNIMLERGHAVVTDFGVARAVSAAGGDRLTSTGLAVGTPAYMSPEQASADDRLDARSDLYSLACVAYEMLAGQPPFTGMTAAVVMARHSLDPVPPLATVRPGLPDPVVRAVEKALSKTPADRFASTASWVEALSAPVYPKSGHLPPAASDMERKPAVRLALDRELGIAVLPFEHVAGDSELAALANGLSEDIATGLSRFSYLSVNEPGAEDPSAVLRTDPGEMARRLGVRYLLTCAVRRSGHLLRLNVRVVDAIAGQNLWAKRYDRDLGAATVFDVQDDLTDRIVATVADSYGVLVRAMSGVIEGFPREGLGPSDWVLRLFGYRQRITAGENAEVRAGLEEAVREHPHSPDLWACLAQIHLDEQSFGFNPGPDTLDRALAAARRAVDADRSSQLGFQMLAQAHFFSRDLAAFAPAAERAMELNPRDSNTLAILGLLIVHAREFDRGAAITERAMELNPHHAGWYHFGPLWRDFHSGEYEKALSHANQINMPELFWQYLAVASICGHLGRGREAEVAVRELLRVDPDFRRHARQNIESWHFASGLLEPLLEGLQKAGLEVVDEPEAATPGDDHAPIVKQDLESKPERSDMAIAVLPIRSATDDGELTTLAEALTEDITAGLTRFTYLDVIDGGDQGTSESDARLVGRKLGARYLLTGRIRRAGSTVRVGVKLIDAPSGSHLWAESYDANLDASDLFDVQDDLTDRIVATVADQQGVLIRSMIASVRDKPIGEMSGLDAVFLMFDYMQIITPELHLRVREALERAVEVEPNFADAWACLSIMYCDEHKHDYNVRPDSLDRALEAGRRAADIDKACQHAYYALAQAHFFRRDFGRFRNAAARAVQINGRDGNTVAFMGILRSYAGDLEEGTALIQRALELNPHHPGWYRFGIFYRHFAQEEYAEALAAAQAMNMPGYYATHMAIGAAAGLLGRLDVAKDAVRELLVVYPEFAERGRAEMAKWVPDRSVLDRYFLGLREGGLEVADA
jgi:serine/threonine-protein kinase